MKLSEQILRKPLYVAFGQALQGGGITSVDLVAIRDAGTVTLTASDGSAAPIAGADASTAGVLTAADKAKLDGLSALTARDLATKLAMPTTTIDAAVSHVRTAGHSAPGDGGGALYQRAAVEPTHNLKVQSADGAWWELVAENGWINVLQAGADPTGVADAIQAFRDCVDFARYNTGDEQSGGANGPTIIVPQGKFLWSDTLEPRTAITMIGAKRGVDGNLGTIIQVAADKTGLILPKSDTLGAGKEVPNDPLTMGANGSFIQGFRLESLGGTDATKHGIHVRVAGVTLSHVEVRKFPGDGVHTRASVGGAQPADQFGNANLWSYDHCYAFDNQQNGFYFSGSDVNGGTSIGLNAVQNGRWGLWDNAFLSNIHIGAHAQGNGHATAGENTAQLVTSVVSHTGQRWSVLPGQELAASTTTPGTDPDVWLQINTQAVTVQFPAWINGNTYVAGGAYYLSGNGGKMCVGCYAEDDNWSLIDGKSEMRGGTNAQAFGINGGTVASGNDVFHGGVTYHNQDPSKDLTEFKIMPTGDGGVFAAMFYAGGPASGLGFRWDNTKKMIRALASSSSGSWAMEILTDNSTNNAGRGAGNAPGLGNVNFPNGVFLGISNNSRLVGNGTAPPSSGAYARGDFLINRSVSKGKILGWHCRASGSPGTWEPLYSVPDVTGNKAARLRANAAEDAVEFAPGPKAGTSTIADTAATVDVVFATAFANANYAVGMSIDGDERIWVTAKAASGFTLNRAATAGARAIDWTATPYEDL